MSLRKARCAVLNPFEELLEELRAFRKEQQEMKILLTAAQSNSPTEIIDRDTLRKRLGGISEPTIIRHEKRGIIPFLTIGSSKRYNWPAVVKALQKKKKGEPRNER